MSAARHSQGLYMIASQVPGKKNNRHGINRSPAAYASEAIESTLCSIILGPR